MSPEPVEGPASITLPIGKLMPAWCYILQLKSGALYVGSTSNIAQRFQDHLNGRACQTTKHNPAVKLVYSEECENIKDAQLREAQIKRWTRAKKEALIAGDFNKLRQLSEPKSKKKNFVEERTN
jgi:putative endonuclease